MTKFLDLTEDDLRTSGFTNEELDVLLKAHEIIIRNKVKGKYGKGPIITGS